jgi:hypothetical protein
VSNLDYFLLAKLLNFEHPAPCPGVFDELGTKILFVRRQPSIKSLRDLELAIAQIARTQATTICLKRPGKERVTHFLSVLAGAVSLDYSEFVPLFLG